MKTGERFSSDRIWEENGKIRFNLQGLIVSVNKEEVAAIIRKNDAPTNPAMPPAASPLPFNKDSKDNKSERLSPYNGQKIAYQQQNSNLEKLHPPSKSMRTSYHSGRVEYGTGLKSISWRMQPNEISGLVKIKTEPTFGGIDQYWRPEQDLTFGNAPLDGIVYGFWQNQLYSIMMWVDGRIGYQRLRNDLFEKYGPGSQNKPDAERYIWLEEKTQRMLEFDTDLNMGIFVMRSVELDDNIKKKYPSEVLTR